MKSVADLQSGMGEIFDDDEDEIDQSEKKRKRKTTKLETQTKARETAWQKEAAEKKNEKVRERKAKTKAKSKDESKSSNDNENEENQPKKRKTSLARPVELSNELSELLGYRVVPRTQVYYYHFLDFKNTWNIFHWIIYFFSFIDYYYRFQL